MPAFYTDFTDTTTTITITGDEHHHIANVFRHQVGDIITLVNGKGLFATGNITQIDKKSLQVDITDLSFFLKKPYEIACAFSLLKEKNDLWIVEKLTELGVTDLFPFISTNSVKNLKANTTEKMLKTAISAIKQCENPWLPNIHPPTTLHKLISEILPPTHYVPLVASERKPILTLCEYITDFPRENICLIIGPEGGFTPEEFITFDSLCIPQVRICDLTLRAETAAIAGVAQLL